MQSEFLVAVISGLGGMFGWGLADFFAKKTIDRIGAIVSLVWAHLFGTLLLILVAIGAVVLFGYALKLPQSPLMWAGLLFFGALQALVYWLAYEGFGKGQLAVLNPIFASYSGIVAIISIVFLGEAVNPLLLFSLVIIFGGVMLLSLDLKGLRKKKFNFSHILGFKEIVAATILAAIWTVGWDQFVGGQDFITFALLMYAFMTLAAFVIAKMLKVGLSGKKTGVWKFLVLIGLCEVVAYLAISLGYSATSLTSIVAVLSGAFSLPTIILARVFLKEKVAPIQTVGTIVIIFGIILLSLQS